MPLRAALSGHMMVKTHNRFPSFVIELLDLISLDNLLGSFDVVGFFKALVYLVYGLLKFLGM